VGNRSSFTFRLERIRALRERREDLARRELAQATSRLTSSQDRLEAVDIHLENARSEQRLATGRRAVFSAEELRARQAFVERIEARRVERVRELTVSESDVSERGGELGDAAREHRMLERLKERQYDEHAREHDRRERMVLDEIAIDRFRGSAA